MNKQLFQLAAVWVVAGIVLIGLKLIKTTEDSQ